MKLSRTEHELDQIDVRLLNLLQDDCKQSFANLGEKVGLSAPAVMERVHKMEEQGVIKGYVAVLNGRRLGREVSAFIGISIQHEDVGSFAREVVVLPEVLECHHVTGSYSLLLKVKVGSTERLKALIDRLRALEGVVRTETMVVLETKSEGLRIALEANEAEPPHRQRRVGQRLRRAARREGGRQAVATGRPSPGPEPVVPPGGACREE